MKKRIDLPLAKPLYSTYHFQGVDTAIGVGSQSLRNRVLNDVAILTCEKRFLSGYSSPEIGIEGSSWNSHNNNIKVWFRMEFLDGYINYVIKRMLEAGYYVFYNNVDDYYIKNKTWCGKRHFVHDGLICGYDLDTKEYCIYAYDNNWVYRKIWTPWVGFEKGRKKACAINPSGQICGIREPAADIQFSFEKAVSVLRDYLGSDFAGCSSNSMETVRGIVVHKYLEEYVKLLARKEIPYERTDRRVFRLLWEHKTVMLERIAKIELSIDHKPDFSSKYREIVFLSDSIRNMYASHIMKCRYPLLDSIIDIIPVIYEKEKQILSELLNIFIR